MFQRINKAKYYFMAGRIKIATFLLMLLAFGAPIRAQQPSAASPSILDSNIVLTAAQSARIDSINSRLMRKIASIQKGLKSEDRKIQVDAAVACQEKELKDLLGDMQYALYCQKRTAAESLIRQRLASKKNGH
jgi:hypothetical protein